MQLSARTHTDTTFLGVVRPICSGPFCVGWISSPTFWLVCYPENKVGPENPKANTRETIKETHVLYCFVQSGISYTSRKNCSILGTPASYLFRRAPIPTTYITYANQMPCFICVARVSKPVLQVHLRTLPAQGAYVNLLNCASHQC